MSPDLVLLDVNLPGENGMSICRKVREVSEVPIVFVTGQNTSMEELSCITLGGDDFVSKPYCAPILLARIAAVLKRTLKNGKEPPNSIQYRGVTLDIVSGTLAHDGALIDLSKTEMRILYYLINHDDSSICFDAFLQFHGIL